MPELVSERGDGAGIDFAFVPLLDDREIWRAGIPALAPLPPETRKIIGCGSEDIGHAVQQVLAAVAVEIDSIFDIGRGHELRLSNFPSPGSPHV